MHEVDQDVVVMYTLVKNVLNNYYVCEGYEGVCRVFTLNKVLFNK